MTLTREELLQARAVIQAVDRVPHDDLLDLANHFMARAHGHSGPTDSGDEALRRAIAIAKSNDPLVRVGVLLSRMVVFLEMFPAEEHTDG